MRKFLVLILCVFCMNLSAGLNEKNDYAESILGESGIVYEIKKGFKVIVLGVIKGSTSSGLFFRGDQITHANGIKLDTKDPRIELGNALNTSTGLAVFRVLRKQKSIDVKINLNRKKAFGKNWPLNCSKSKAYIKESALFIKKKFASNMYRNLEMDLCFAGLFLLSTGDDDYLPTIRKIAHLAKANSLSTSAWALGYQGLFLTEYYLRTKDSKVLPIIEEFAKRAIAGHAHGAWSHSVKGFGSGYMNGAVMNAASMPIVMGLALAQECGVKVSSKEFTTILAFHYRVTGYGTVAYGDHRPIYFIGDNGKNGMLACVLQLFDGNKFKRSAEVLAMSEVNSYPNFENGHGTMFFNVMWRSIAAVHIPSNMQSYYRLHMDKLAWYYDLCRRESGAFHPYKVDKHWIGGLNVRFSNDGEDVVYKAQGELGTTGAMAMAFTAPLRHLRIMGKKTRWKNEIAAKFIALDKKSMDFLNPDYSKGGSDMGLLPDEIIAKFKHKFNPQGEALSIKFCANMIRHFDPVVRFYAAANLGYIGDAAVPEILKALNSDDDRVRRAGLDTFNGRMYWSRSPQCKISEKIIQEKLMPYAIKIMHNPKEDYWLQESAINAFRKAPQSMIVSEIPNLLELLKKDDWWWHYDAVCNTLLSLDIKKLKEKTALKIIDELQTALLRQTHCKALFNNNHRIKKFILGVNSRVNRNMPSKSNESSFGDVFKLSSKEREKVLLKYGAYLNKPKIEKGYREGAGHTYQHGIFHAMAGFRPEHIFETCGKDINEYLAHISEWGKDSSGQHLQWIFIGDRWGETVNFTGLLKWVELAEDKAKPIIPGLKVALAQFDKMKINISNKRDKRDMAKIDLIKAQTLKTIEAYESKYGNVSMYKSPNKVRKK